MEQQLQQLLQLSAKLYEQLGQTVTGENRDAFITAIHDKLDERSDLIDALQDAQFKYDENNRLHRTLAELDKGINERLQHVMTQIKADLRDLRTLKAQEQRYANPYANVQTMDGRYYDRKK